jgi:hypothetical protein
MGQSSQLKYEQVVVRGVNTEVAVGTQFGKDVLEHANGNLRLGDVQIRQAANG